MTRVQHVGYTLEEDGGDASVKGGRELVWKIGHSFRTSGSKVFIEGPMTKSPGAASLIFSTAKKPEFDRRPLLSDKNRRIERLSSSELMDETAKGFGILTAINTRGPSAMVKP